MRAGSTVYSIWRTAALAAVCVMFLACGGDAPTNPPGGDPPGGDPPGGDPPGGDPPEGDPPAPVFVRVASGFGHTCALRDAGDIFCWGRNDEGQLGTGEAGEGALVPVPVASDREFVSVSVGDFHTCALDSAGAVYCWGANDQGEVGDGTNVARDVPVAVRGGLTFNELTVGGAHACGIASDIEAYCWGDDSFGQLGNLASGSSNVPLKVPFERAEDDDREIRFTTITAGGGHTCGLDIDHGPYCWGNNGTGQLGDESSTSSEVPVPVAGGDTSDFRSITAGASHTCASTGGQADCWGFNLFGQLGDGTNTDSDAPGSPGVDVLFPFLSAGSDHTCGLTGNGIAYCWGFNGGGRLGDGTEVDRNAPAPVAGDLTFSDVSAGVLHTCGVTTDGDVYCWGSSAEGQRGDGTTETSLTPAPVVEP